VVRPQRRGAAARELKASTRGAARGKRAAPQHDAMTTRRPIAGQAVEETHREQAEDGERGFK
jgi:hypothetical protein